MSEVLQKRVGKAVIVHPPTMRVLILRLNEAERRVRSTPEKEFDEWHIPGGSEEPADGGFTQNAATREALEETGLTVRVLGSLGMDGWTALYEGKPAEFTAEFYACVAGEDQSEPPEVTVGHESDSSAWVAMDELEQYVPRGLTPQAVRFIPLALQKVAERA